MAADEAGDRGLGQVRWDMEGDQQFPFYFERLEKPLEEFYTTKTIGE